MPTVRNTTTSSSSSIAAALSREQADRFRNICEFFNYSQDVTRLIPPIIDKKEANNVNTYGVELEVATDYDLKDIVTCFDDPFLIAKSDGSISGRGANKYELVTTVCSLRTQRKYWRQFFERLDMTKFDTSRETSNGFHVHIGRSAFCTESKHDEHGDLRPSEFHIQKFSWFINNPVNRWFMLETSERTQDNIASYCNFVRYSSSRESEYRQFRNVVTNGMSRMSAVNHTKGPTVEVRLFKGIVSGATVIKNLELVDSIVEYTREASIKECTIPKWMEWLEKMPRSRYRFLRLHLEAIGSAHLSATTRILNALKGVENNKRKAENIVNKMADDGVVTLNEDIVDSINKVYEGLFRLNYNYKTGRVGNTTGSTVRSSMKEFDDLIKISARV